MKDLLRLALLVGMFAVSGLGTTTSARQIECGPDFCSQDTAFCHANAYSTCWPGSYSLTTYCVYENDCYSYTYCHFECHPM